jgi:hypothetical protein
MTIRELDLVKNIIEFRNEIAKTADWTTRQESDGLTFYNNDLDFLKRVWKFSPKSTIFEVQVMPPGTITFARQPKHQYRVYLSGSRIEKESRDDLRDYLSRTPKAEPCGALKTWLSYDYKRLWLYSNEKHFIDYDEPAILTMLHLICPKLIGKSYKLERK